MAIKNEHTHSKHERLCLSVPEVAKTLGISRGLAYELVHSGRLPALHFGRRLLIPRAALERMLNGTQETGVSYK